MTDIQFGDIEYQGPKASARPDQDAHFAVVECGSIDESDLPIFVDLDVMRDMETHARTNTEVELGGVMLGGQYVDDAGNPFVVITDSLRAEHYEATKGSFKFTHETWEDITRRRDEFASDLQMVGWYHTHPDWGVFLSGMDLFICNNFFNRPFDLALVIDPCRGDRGWFQWTDQQPPTTRETGGFYLMSNRFRMDELVFQQSIYSGDAVMAADPRFSGAGTSLVQPVVNINDQRTPVQNLAIMGMLTIQLLVLALIGYKLLADDQASEDQKLAEINSRLQLIGQAEKLEAQEAAYGKVISALTAGSPDADALAQQLLQLESQTEQLNSNLSGQMALASAAEQQRDQALEANREAESKISLLNNDLEKTRNELFELSEYKQQKEKEAQGDAPNLPQWAYYLGAAVLVIVGLAGGFWLGGQDFGKENRERAFGRRMRDDSDADDDESADFQPDQNEIDAENDRD